MTLVESLKQRIENLERTQDFLVRQLNNQQESVPQLSSGKREVHLAELYNNGSYPSDPATVFPFRFIDGTFTESSGNQTPTYTALTAADQRKGFYLGATYPTAGTVVMAWRQNNRWWLLPAVGGTMMPSSFYWQRFSLVDNWYYESGTSSAVNPSTQFGGGSNQGPAYAYWTATGAGATPQEFGYGNQILLDQVGTTIGDAQTGNLVVQSVGLYLFLAHFVVRLYRDSTGVTMPTPPENLVFRPALRIGELISGTPTQHSIYYLQDMPWVSDSNIYVPASTVSGDFQARGIGFYEFDDLSDSNPDRLSLCWTIPSSTATDLGFQVTNAELMVIKLPT